MLFVHLDLLIGVTLALIVIELAHYRIQVGNNTSYEKKGHLIFLCFFVYDFMTFWALLFPILDCKVGRLMRGEPDFGLMWSNFSLLVLSGYLFNLSMCHKRVFHGFGHKIALILHYLVLYTYLMEEYRSLQGSNTAFNTNLYTTSVGVLEVSHLALVPGIALSYPFLV